MDVCQRAHLVWGDNVYKFRVKGNWYKRCRLCHKRNVSDGRARRLGKPVDAQRALRRWRSAETRRVMATMICEAFGLPVL